MRLTAAITARIEEMVRADPGQWLWIHNRWPTERDKRADGRTKSHEHPPAASWTRCSSAATR